MRLFFPKLSLRKSCRASRVESCVLNFNESCRQTGAVKVARETETRSEGKVVALRVLRVARKKLDELFASVGVAAKVSRLKWKLKFYKLVALRVLKRAC